MTAFSVETETSDNSSTEFLGALSRVNYEPDKTSTSVIDSLTPPESVESRRDSPSPSDNNTNSSTLVSLNNFNILPKDFSFPCPGPSNISSKTSSKSFPHAVDKDYRTKASTACSATLKSYYDRERPGITFAECDKARIEIINPKLEFDKVQRKHGPKGKISEQRVTNGLVSNHRSGLNCSARCP